MTKKVRIKVGDNSYVGVVQEVEGKKVPFTSISDSTSILGFKYSQYTRRLLLEGKLDKPYLPLKVKEENFSKWYISIESLMEYLKGRVVRDGSRRFILKANLEDKEKIEKALKGIGVEFTLELAYVKGKGKKVKKASSPKAPEAPLEVFTFSKE